MRREHPVGPPCRMSAAWPDQAASVGSDGMGLHQLSGLARLELETRIRRSYDQRCPHGLFGKLSGENSAQVARAHVADGASMSENKRADILGLPIVPDVANNRRSSGRPPQRTQILETRLRTILIYPKLRRRWLAGSPSCGNGCALPNRTTPSSATELRGSPAVVEA
jgi:hypothetical protein